eukprot:1149146-Pelagomonas_calceolata.AAC.1
MTYGHFGQREARSVRKQVKPWPACYLRAFVLCTRPALVHPVFNLFPSNCVPLEDHEPRQGGAKIQLYGSNGDSASHATQADHSRAAQHQGVKCKGAARPSCCPATARGKCAFPARKYLGKGIDSVGY